MNYFNCFILMAVMMFIGIDQLQAQRKNSKDELKVYFLQQEYDMGTISQGMVALYEFEFTNHEEIPVVVKQVSRACNVTIPEYSRDEILPGETGFIRVSLNPRDLRGEFRRSMKVILASDEQSFGYHIYVKGRVVRSLN